MLDRSLLYFLALAKTRNFTRAAESLFVTQPAFSRKIAELEEELGCQLFLRKTRPIELTPAGETFLKWANRLMEDLQQMETDLEKVRQGVTGSLRIGYNGASQLPFLNAGLKAMEEHYPHIECVSRRGEPPRIEHFLAEGELDGIFTTLPHVKHFSWMDYITVRPGGIYALINAKHPLAHEKGILLSQIAPEPYVNFERHMSPDAYDFVSSAFWKAGAVRNDAVCVQDVEDIAVMVAADRGYALMSQSAAESFRSDKLCAVPLLDFPTGYDLVFAWNRQHVSQSLMCFRSVLSSLYGSAAEKRPDGESGAGTADAT